jgi:glucosamine--fructose-6-phosphate aminotransferase (isomerizing)
MCGIIGYLGEREAIPILMEGLKRLEYRGYDSAGIAVFDHDRIEVKKCKGKISNLETLVKTGRISASIGIGHTRWATHGRPSVENAHPHKCDGVAVVHNGIIENCVELRRKLQSQNHIFNSETDTEIISHLMADNLKKGLEPLAAMKKSLEEIEGSYALAIMVEANPDILLVARNQSPLILGLGEGEVFIASDVPAIIPYTRQVIYLEDGDVALLTHDRIMIEDQSGFPVERPVQTISWDASQAEKGGYPHFMLKEIFEQPQAVADTLRGRISVEQGDVFLEGLEDKRENFLSAKRIYLVACGTSYHAGLIGRYYFERFCLLPSEVELASEFRHRNPIIGPETLMILISQSGETADTLKALREGKAKGCQTLAICNVLGSSISRLADFTFYTHAGPEIGVASTKAFSTQIVALYLTALALARDRSLVSPVGMKDKLQELLKLPQLIKKCLDLDPKIQAIARKYSDFQNFLYLGRGINYPLALEGALKLKEISYIHAEGYPAGEMKHGPIALIDREMPVLALATHGEGRDKIRSNIEEARARCGRVIALVNEGDDEIAGRVEESIAVPRTQEELQPILNIIPLQLLAYHIAVNRGTNIDQPRNLAKSVTVE